MSSREKILSAIRKDSSTAAPLPQLPSGIAYDDPRGQFCAMLAAVGGTAEIVADLAAAKNFLQELEIVKSAGTICSCLPELMAGNVELDAVESPHQLQSVDLAVLPGRFGVAENGAIWVTDQGLRHRVLPFITQHLILVLPANELVHNMHQAYNRITLAGPQFGAFISGPSKTADIEQSLVIGAHGARSMIALLVEDEFKVAGELSVP